ncbi:hypothetical protein [Devosia sp. ZB163]|uniref:hypothetical protein n=1 Tax=Devosia sp. ZB163 TaxID=3025938 RepID=UPI0030811560
MPTLIRLIVILLVLVGIGYGAMFALVAMVEPRDKQVTIRIPARELVPQTGRDPLVRREIDTTRTTTVPAAAPVAAPEVPAAPAPAPATDGSVTTLAPGIE